MENLVRTRIWKYFIFCILMITIYWMQHYKINFVSCFMQHYRIKFVSGFLDINWSFTFMLFFSSPGHRPCELLSWVSIRPPSVSFSHLNLLLWYRWTELSQTCQKCSLDGPLPDLWFWCWFEIQHGCQGPYVFSLAEI